jgi:hypothetical protein
VTSGSKYINICQFISVHEVSSARLLVDVRERLNSNNNFIEKRLF